MSFMKQKQNQLIEKINKLKDKYFHNLYAISEELYIVNLRTGFIKFMKTF